MSGNWKNRLCSAIASEKFNKEPKYQKDRMYRFRLVSNSVYQFKETDPQLRKNLKNAKIVAIFCSYEKLIKWHTVQKHKRKAAVNSQNSQINFISFYNHISLFHWANDSHELYKWHEISNPFICTNLKCQTSHKIMNTCIINWSYPYFVHINCNWTTVQIHVTTKSQCTRPMLICAINTVCLNNKR